MGADGSNTGAFSFTNSAFARPSVAPAEQSPHTSSSVRYLAARAFAHCTRSVRSSLPGTGSGARALATRSLDHTGGGCWSLSFTAGGTTDPETQNAAMARCNADERSQGRCQPRTAACADGRQDRLSFSGPPILAQTGLAPGQPVAGKGRRGKLIVGIQTVTNSFNPWLPDLDFFRPGIYGDYRQFCAGDPMTFSADMSTTLNRILDTAADNLRVAKISDSARSRSQQRHLRRDLQPPAGNLSGQHHAGQHVCADRRDLLCRHLADADHGAAAGREHDRLRILRRSSVRSLEPSRPFSCIS